MFGQSFRNRRVLVTGHTGFKGSWLCEWLLNLGANVRGYALAPPTSPCLFEQLGLSTRIEDVRADVRDHQRVHAEIKAFAPEYIFHLAAQPLVRYSYVNPVETFETNVMGTINVMDALRLIDRPCVAIFVTTDKCYENREWLQAYREEDAMGGHDPYSASKGCAELTISAYRRSYFSDASNIRIASARAGNVIGGGDWASDRIIPDCIRTLTAGAAVPVRNKKATRPWQHVLEPLAGYLWLAARLAAAEDQSLASSFNFGPPLASNRTVAELVNELLKHWEGNWTDQSDPNSPHEASRLNLAIDKAFHLLQWSPTWSFERTVRETARWYQQAQHERLVAELTCDQIRLYTSDADVSKQAWANPQLVLNQDSLTPPKQDY
jgi:CDP-glucose 4,6-dehydratase